MINSATTQVTIDQPILPQLNIIRAIASLAVCFGHLTIGGHLFELPDPIAQVTQYGHLGVYMFFILSGFVICYSIPLNYSYSDTSVYLKKRIVRIEPPFVFSIFLVLGLNLVTSLLLNKLQNFTFDPINLLFHFFYINNFTGPEYSYINPVYWTLGIEFQFYIFVALSFPFIIRWRAKSIVLLFLISSVSLILPEYIIFLTYLPFFILGISTFLKMKRLINNQVYFVFLFISLSFVLWFFDIPKTISALFTILIILFIKKSNTVTDFFSKISYSLYLVHVPIGAKIVSFGKSYASTYPQKIALILFAILVSVLSAYVFHLIIERPFMKKSKRMKYKKIDLSAL